MNILKSIFLLTICISTYGQRKYNDPSITVTEAKLKETKIPAFENLNTIPKEWIKVEKDGDGYLVYDPCDGSTPSIRIEKENIIINSNLESETYNYGKYKTIVENKSFKLEAWDEKYKLSFIITAKIIDYEKGITLWTFDGQSWLMIPIENRDGFRMIKNNCPTEKKPELTFLSVREIIKNTSR